MRHLLLLACIICIEAYQPSLRHLVGISGSGAYFGVNIMNSKIPSTQEIDDLVTRGVRNFRVINNGGWNDNALTAINAAAQAHSNDLFSLQITSMGFSSGCGLPVWMDFSMAATVKKLSALSSIKRILVQLDLCDICSGSDTFCYNPTELGMGQNVQWTSAGQAKAYLARINGMYTQQIRDAAAQFPSNVEFIIPFQDNVATPAAVTMYLKTVIQPLQNSGRKYYLEGTIYPFWNPSSQAFEGFPADVVKGNVAAATSMGFDGYTVSETGWPRSCAKPDGHRPASLINMCNYVDTTIQQASGASLVYYFKTTHDDAGDGCGADSWGLYDTSQSAVCTSMKV